MDVGAQLVTSMSTLALALTLKQGVLNLLNGNFASHTC